MVESILEDMKDRSGSKLKRTAEVWEGYTLPARYLVMVAFESLAAVQGGMPYVHVKPQILFIHGPEDACYKQGILERGRYNFIRVPRVDLSDSMFAEHSYREILQGH